MKYLSTLILCFLSFICVADNPITGNLSPHPGNTETYTVNWDSWSGVYETYANVYWNVVNGTIIESTKHTVTIQWDNNIPSWLNVTGTIEVSEDLGGGMGTLYIEITNFTLGESSFCDGVLGAPLVAVNFGQGNNPGPPLPAGVTTYTYNPFCQIVHDQYTLVNNLIACRSDWHDIPNDHTGNPSGYFLLVDGSSSPGEFYRTTVSGLTDAFQYQFSVWAGNFDKPIAGGDNGYTDPRIKFQIRDLNNNLLQSSDIIQLPLKNTFEWEQISFMFDIPSGTTSVQIIIMTENGGELGNDVALDDISFAPCYPPIIASFSPNPIFVNKSYTCDNGTVTLNSWWPTPSIPYVNPSYKWQKSSDNGNTWVDIPGATSNIFIISENQPNIYKYRIIAYESSNPSQFVVSNMLSYFVQQMIVDQKTFYVNGCSPSPVELNPTYYLLYSDPFGPPLTYTFNWSPSNYLNNNQISNPTVTLPQLPPPNPPNPPLPLPPINYSYSLTVQNTNFGCTASNTQIVAHINPRKVFIFNAFTPNGDGSNDFFYPVNISDYNNFGAEFWIYDRWGQVIFYRNQGATPQNWAWDGKVGGIPQASGVYVWRLKIPDCPNNYVACPSCDAAPDNGGLTIHGTVTLIR